MLPGITPMVGAGWLKPFPIVVTTSTGSSASTQNTAHSVALPSGVSAGDFILIVATVQDANETTVITDPAGFTKRFETYQASASTGMKMITWHKTASGSEGASVSYGTSTARCSSYTAFRISGASRIDSVTAVGASASAKPPALTPSWGLANTLWVASVGIRSGTTANINAAPTSYTGLLNVVSTLSTASGNTRTGSAVKSEKAASNDPSAFTLSVATQDWIAATIAVN